MSFWPHTELESVCVHALWGQSGCMACNEGEGREGREGVLLAVERAGRASPASTLSASANLAASERPGSTPLVLSSSATSALVHPSKMGSLVRSTTATTFEFEGFRALGQIWAGGLGHASVFTRRQRAAARGSALWPLCSRRLTSARGVCGGSPCHARACRSRICVKGPPRTAS